MNKIKKIVLIQVVIIAISVAYYLITRTINCHSGYCALHIFGSIHILCILESLFLTFMLDLSYKKQPSIIKAVLMVIFGLAAAFLIFWGLVSLFN